LSRSLELNDQKTTPYSNTESCLISQLLRASLEPNPDSSTGLGIQHLLVVGPSVPKFLQNSKDCTIVHHPLIAFRPLRVSTSQLVLSSIAESLIITSKHAAFFYIQALTKSGLTSKSNYLYCVGKASAQAAHTQFPQATIKTALIKQQEGVIDMLLQDRPTSIAWPRSKMARSLIPQTLLNEDIKLIDVPLYEPYETKIIPSLENIDEVFFSCPSSVRAFFALFMPQEVAHLSFSAIGPITLKELTQKGVPDARIHPAASSI